MEVDVQQDMYHTTNGIVVEKVKKAIMSMGRIAIIRVRVKHVARENILARIQHVKIVQEVSTKMIMVEEVAIHVHRDSTPVVDKNGAPSVRLGDIKTKTVPPLAKSVLPVIIQMQNDRPHANTAPVGDIKTKTVPPLA